MALKAKKIICQYGSDESESASRRKLKESQ